MSLLVVPGRVDVVPGPVRVLVVAVPGPAQVVPGQAEVAAATKATIADYSPMT